MITERFRVKLKFLVVLLSVVTLALIAQPIASSVRDDSISRTFERDDAKARDLFISIIPVLKHPRCLNCHATGDYPRQGDDNHIHTFIRKT